MIVSKEYKNSKKDGSVILVYPTFVITSESKDLMTKGRDFYAIWNEDLNLWSTSEAEVVRQVDTAVRNECEKVKAENPDAVLVPLYMWKSDSGVIDKWHRYVQKQIRDNYHNLDEKIIFANTQTVKEDYASKKLSYSLQECDIPAYEEIMSTLYDPEERDKLEWAIGSIIAGDAKTIQKFIVLYGAAGSGKSTVLNIIQMLFEDYVSMFDAKELGQANNSFALESFNKNPLVSIQHDGDLSKIEDNTKLNSIVAHEKMLINEKFKSRYEMRFNSFLFMGTNKPVRITEAKSGIIRRLIDVHPSGRLLKHSRYTKLMHAVKYELGGIAWHCLNRYQEMGYEYYDKYVPTEMIAATNDFYDFVQDKIALFLENEDGIDAKKVYAAYKEYCDFANVSYPLSYRKVVSELKNYFTDYKEQYWGGGKHVRNYYTGFIKDKFQNVYDNSSVQEENDWLDLKEQHSILDDILSECPAQLADEQEERPMKAWANVKTKLHSIDTHKLHYVKMPNEHYIFIDFDLKDKSGRKSIRMNLAAARKSGLPETYAELSKGGGLHLHYIYEGDVDKLSRVFDDNIEVKVLKGDAALRRRLTKCNDISITRINSGLPLKGDKVVLNFNTVKDENHLRNLVKKALRKEIENCANTTPAVHFIKKVLDDAYESGLIYDISDLKDACVDFALNSTHQSDTCLKLVEEMKFRSADPDAIDPKPFAKDQLIFFDCECFPNFFGVAWKIPGKKVVKMFNPSSEDIGELMKYKLVGFNNRRYDNHMLYARYIGYTNAELYDLSTRIIGKEPNAFFASAYNISYADVYDFTSKKQSLKKYEIELGLPHVEFPYRWDEPLPEDKWESCMEYCANDVIATEAVFNARHDDFIAREILAKLSGLTVNDTNNQHTRQIIFGDNRHPQNEFIYTDLSKDFPGYEYSYGKSTYKGEVTGEGGYVYAEPGMYSNVALLDIASMHPTSAIVMNIFGDRYTAKFKDLLDIRLHIKHKEYDAVRNMFDGKLAEFLESDDSAKALSTALKIPINSVYGLTSAKFDNPFKDPRNKDNIVAKRGALFMINLKGEVQKKGFTVAHIKTDSIKIPNATEEIIKFVMDYGKKYGYTFEHEATYAKMCLVNDAVYIAKYKEPVKDKKTGKDIWWSATGTQFQQPYVFKTLFSHEPIEFEDFCETRSVTSALYLDMNEDLPDVSDLEKERDKLKKELTNGKSKLNKLPKEEYDQKVVEIKERIDELVNNEIPKGHNYIFIGKVGEFVPVKSGAGGGILLREAETGKYSAAPDSKGYRWLESQVVKTLNKEDMIDKTYCISKVDEAVGAISEYGDFEWFVSDNKELDLYSNEPTF